MEKGTRSVYNPRHDSLKTPFKIFNEYYTQTETHLDNDTGSLYPPIMDDLDLLSLSQMID